MNILSEKLVNTMLKVAASKHPGRGMWRGGAVAGALGTLGLYIVTPTTPFAYGPWNTIAFMISLLLVFGGFGAYLAGMHIMILHKLGR